MVSNTYYNILLKFKETVMPNDISIDEKLKQIQIDKYKIKKEYEFYKLKIISNTILKVIFFIAGLGMIVIGSLSQFWMLIPTGVFVIGYSLGKDFSLKK